MGLWCQCIVASRGDKVYVSEVVARNSCVQFNSMGLTKKHAGDDPEAAVMATMTTEAKIQQFFQEAHLEGGKLVAAHELVTMRGETIGESKSTHARIIFSLHFCRFVFIRRR